MTPKEHSFDPNLFLAKVGSGRSVAEYRKKQVVFAQSDQSSSLTRVAASELEPRLSDM